MSLPNPESITCSVCGGVSRRFYETTHEGAPWMYRCEKCGFCITQPMPLGLDEVYEDAYSSTEGTSVKNLQLTPDYLRKIRPYLPPGKFSFLEIGGSYGWLAEYVRDAFGAEVMLLEPGRTAVEMAKKRGLPAHAGFIEDFQPEHPFDVACATHVIEHVNDVHAFFSASQRMLKPGGLLILITPNATAWKFTNFKRQWGWAAPNSHTLFLSPEAARLLLEQHGFEAVAIRPCRPHFSYYPLFVVRWLSERRARKAPAQAPPAPGGSGSAAPAAPARRGGLRRWLTRPIVWTEYLFLIFLDFLFGKKRDDELILVGRKK